MESVNIPVYFLGLTFLMICSAFFSGSETAFSALSKAQIQKLRNDKHKTSSYIIKFIDEPKGFFITVLFGNILVNVAFVTITGSLIYQRLFNGNNIVIASFLAISVEVVILLLCGEITPKIYAIKHAESFSKAASFPLWLFSIFVFPFRKILRLLTDTLLPLFGIKAHTERRKITREELKEMVKAAEHEGVLDDQEAKVIRNIFDLCDIDAKEVMTPRTEMVCIEVSMKIQEAFDKAKETGFSHIPVYRKETDKICGIFHVKDFPKWMGRKIKELGNSPAEELTIDEFLSNSEILNRCNPGNNNTLVRQPFFEFEGRRVGPLMRALTNRKERMAVLFDEYGGISGLVTIEDILEEVLGEISDKYDLLDRHTITSFQSETETYEAPGLMSLRKFNKKLNMQLNISTAETLGGYVIILFDAIPKKGDKIIDRKHNIEFEVISMDGSRIDRIKIKRKKRKTDSTGQSSKIPLILLSILSLSLLSASTGNISIPATWLSISVFSTLLIFSLFLIAFYAGSETAVISASREYINVLAKKGNKKAIIIKNLLDTPESFLITVLVGTNLMTTIAGQACVILASYAFPGQEGLQKLLNTVLLTIIILIFCEILPKTAFYTKADSLSLRCASLLRISDILFHPVAALILRTTDLIMGSSGENSKQEKLRITRDELKLLATMGGREGALRPDQLRMIQNVLNQEKRTIGKLMVPLVNVAALPKTASVSDFYKKSADTGFTRIAVYDDKIENMIGFVNVLDLLYSEAKKHDISEFLNRNVCYESETEEILSLLHQLQKIRSPLIFVVEEFGEVIGLVTKEDLIEEIIGESHNETHTGKA